MTTIKRPTRRVPFTPVIRQAPIDPQPPYGLKNAPVEHLQEGVFRFYWENLPITAAPHDIRIPPIYIHRKSLNAIKQRDNMWYWSWIEPVLGKTEFEVDGKKFELWILQVLTGLTIEAYYNNTQVRNFPPTTIPNDVASDWLRTYQTDLLVDRLENSEAKFRELYEKGHIRV